MTPLCGFRVNPTPHTDTRPPPTGRATFFVRVHNSRISLTISKTPGSIQQGAFLQGFRPVAFARPRDACDRQLPCGDSTVLYCSIH